MKKHKSRSITFIYSNLSILYGCAIALTGMVVIMQIVGLFLKFPFPTAMGFPVNVTFANPGMTTPIVDGVSLNPGLSGSLLVFRPSRIISLYSCIYSTIVWGGMAYILFLIRKIVMTVYSGNPFVAENARRMRIVAIVIIFAPLLLDVLSRFAVSSLLQGRSFPGLVLMNHGIGEQNSILIPFGLLLFVISEVFRIGVTLKEENDLTI